MPSGYFIKVEPLLLNSTPPTLLYVVLSCDTFIDSSNGQLSNTQPLILLTLLGIETVLSESQPLYAA